MALWCLKYSLAFLLGAMTLGLFIILQLQRDVIRVEIHWKRPPPSSYQSFVDIVAIKSPSMGANSSNDNISRSDVSSIHLNHPPQEHKKDASHHDASLVVPEQAQLQKSGMNLLSRHPRQVSPLLEGQSQLSSIVMTTRPPRTKESTTRKASDSKKSRQTGEIENALRSVVPIEDVLSKTAPDWVGASLPPVSRDDVNCGDNVCMEHLSEVDRDLFKTCIRRTVAKKDRIGPILPIANSSCHFQNGTRRHPVALASFPGSGNTWMRGLLQKITGICAGSLYCDNVLRARGFTGEFIRSSSVIAVKSHGIKGLFTHGELPRKVFNRAPIYGAAILLVRDPKSALVAEWHRERTKRQTNVTTSNHYLFAGEDFFKTNKDWDHYVREKGKRWKDHVSGWIIAGKNNPFHIVRYEDLKNDTVKEMKKALNFLGFSHISETDIRERLGEGYNSFYRNHRDDFGHFTEAQKSFVRQQVQDTINTLREHGKEDSFPIYKYL